MYWFSWEFNWLNNIYVILLKTYDAFVHFRDQHIIIYVNSILFNCVTSLSRTVSFTCFISFVSSVQFISPCAYALSELCLCKCVCFSNTRRTFFMTMTEEICMCSAISREFCVELCLCGALSPCVSFEFIVGVARRRVSDSRQSPRSAKVRRPRSSRNAQDASAYISLVSLCCVERWRGG